MFKNYIKKYINNLSINDIKMYALQNNISLNNEECQKIHEIILKDWENIIYNNHEVVLKKYQNELSFEILSKANSLITFYKNKYQGIIKG